MPRMKTPVWVRQITHSKGVAAWKCVGYFTRRAFNGPDQRRRPVSRALSRTHASIAFAPICQSDRIMKVPLACGTDRNRLPCG
jgi:hypothetical protein